jgi:uncharacterized membrane protein required for colicin V production
MPINTFMSVLTCAEFLLWAIAGFIFWKSNLQRRFRAMSTYLAPRVTATPLLILLLQLQGNPGTHRALFYSLYFYTYWSVYIASAVLVYFVCVEVFRSVFASFPGFIRLSTIFFGWTAFVTVVLGLSVNIFDRPISESICYIAPLLTKVASVVLLCLLGLLGFVMKSLKLSASDRRFGLILGFGLLAGSDFMFGLLVHQMATLTAPLQFLDEFLTLASIGIWIGYFAVPEPERRPIVLPANSTIYRWNEIASALGRSPQAAVAQPARSFFLSDVEKVVDKVLARKLQSSETKS